LRRRYECEGSESVRAEIRAALEPFTPAGRS
jgi:hypothetical protein